MIQLWRLSIPCLLALLHNAAGLSPPSPDYCQRRTFFGRVASSIFITATTVSTIPTQSEAKCTDIESCREIGEKKVQQDLEDNPVVPLENGVRYKLLKSGFGEKAVEAGSTIDLIYVVNTPARYMFSQGFGLEKVDNGFGNKQSDSGLDSYVVTLGTKNLPIGVEQAVIGMKKGERRKVEVPPSVGFDTSDWKPAPSTSLGKQAIGNYKRLLRGNGPNNPPFAAPTIWQVEILSIR